MSKITKLSLKPLTRCERRVLPKKKEIRIPFEALLFLGKWCRVATYFSLYKKNTNYKIHD